jgi:hypothetical protein
MREITIERTIRKIGTAKTAAGSHSLRESVRKFFASESHWEFVVEALLFATLGAVSAWPIIAAAIAISDLLQASAG